MEKKYTYFHEISLLEVMIAMDYVDEIPVLDETRFARFRLPQTVTEQTKFFGERINWRMPFEKVKAFCKFFGLDFNKEFVGYRIEPRILKLWKNRDKHREYHIKRNKNRLRQAQQRLLEMRKARLERNKMKY